MHTLHRFPRHALGRLAGPCLALCALNAASQPADPACAPVVKALNAALAQPRIHAAIDEPPDAEALKAGVKPTLMHSIVIEQVQYSNAVNPRFTRTALESKDFRLLAADMGPFAVEQGCKAAASERIGGRDTQVFTAAGDLGRGEIRFKLWLDKATGLPMRAVSDEPGVDDANPFAKPPPKGKPAAPKPPPPRVVATHAYLFGDLVKPPGTGGVPDAAALARLQAILKGSP